MHAVMAAAFVDEAAAAAAAERAAAERAAAVAFPAGLYHSKCLIEVTAHMFPREAKDLVGCRLETDYCLPVSASA